MFSIHSGSSSDLLLRAVRNSFGIRQLPEKSAHWVNGTHALLIRKCIKRNGIVPILQTLGEVFNSEHFNQGSTELNFRLGRESETVSWKGRERMAMAAGSTSSISELASRFKVYWDVLPEYIFINHEKRQIGFMLELSGTLEDVAGHLEPGGEKCREIYRALNQIAEEVLPQGTKDTSHQFEPYDQSVYYSSKHGNRPEVVLRIRITHRKAFERPVDSDQIQYLNELQKRLEDVGIREY